MSKLKQKFKTKADALANELKTALKEHGDKVVSEVTLAQAYGGARGVKCMTWEASLLDPDEGIRFRGYTIPECQERLPKASGGDEPLPEAMFYLLLTGDIPTDDEAAEVTAEWRKREALPDYTVKMLDSLPKDMHPMTQFSLGILSMQKDSIFAQKYRDGIKKTEYWDPMYEDVMTLLGRLPILAAKVYNRSYRKDQKIKPDPKLDWGGNFARMMGYEDEQFKELMRLYLSIHCDHEGGNVSAHTTRLVGSALSDAFYSLSAGINGLAGPLHGLANQEVLRWIMNVKEQLGGGVPSTDQLKKFLWDTLNSGQVIPGYGHAVLRKTDPRYMAQREFALKHLPDDEIFQTVSNIYEVAPDILREHGKAKNPWPNVDAHSGCLLVHYGMTEYDFYTVLFGVSRAMGVLNALIWERALGLSIERPKSFTFGWAKKNVLSK